MTFNLEAIANSLARRWYTTAALAFMLAMVSAQRILGPGRDYIVGGYSEFFYWARGLTSISQIQTFRTHDWGFGLILYGIAQLGNWPDSTFFFLIALPVLWIKFWCFQRFSPNFGVAAALYIALFFVSHEYTQLRVGSAIALMMLSICIGLAGRRYLVSGAMALGAMSLHLSVTLALGSVLISALSAKLAIALAAAGLFLGGTADWFQILDPRIAVYIQAAKQYPTPNPLSSLKLYEYATLFLFFYYLSEIRRKGWVVVEAAGWLLFVGIGIFFGTFSVPVFAYRFSELFAALMPFLVAGLAVLMPKNLALVYVAAGIAIGCWASFRILS